MSRSLSNHYRDPVFDFWNNLAIKYVKFALYKGNSEVAYVMFNGNGSSNMDWFTLHGIEHPGQTDTFRSLSETELEPRNHRSRLSNGSTLMLRFLINIRFEGCDNDRGYVAVIDG
ncbi:hypothetical protein DPMN_051387 [Dreissena polymorpha]|uniref:Uncharacterized protein n=1 Tax=Dreissena polymorpha TaxID=45954 RepID=A0A9D4CJ91_DREPO|nr:hypothetical protein DPMN_051387 [Dreissena polymorpha]